MPPSNVSWGIEVGFGAVKAIKLESDGDGVRVADFAVIAHPKVLSTPDIDQEDAMRPALASLASGFDLSGASVAISVPGHQSFARFAKLPPVDPRKVADIVKFEAVQQIPFPLDDVEWDYQTFVSPTSPEVEVGIFAITRPRIMERLALLNEVGITPDIATISPVAAYNALAFDLEFTEATPGTIILDVGTTASDLIVAEAGRVWIRTFPVGGHQFTEALVGAFPNLSYAKAEKLKREAEESKHARHVFQAMRPVFTDLVQEIQRSIGYYQSIHPGARLTRLIGLGSTFQLPGLRKYLKQQLQMDVYRLEQLKRARVDAAREADLLRVSMNMCTAYGLALQALGNGTLNANLMPVRVVRDAMWKGKRGWFAAAAGLAAATAGVAFLRPLLDSTAFTGAQRPVSIQKAVSEARRLAALAEEAGVTEASEGDLTASEIVGLLGSRDVYPQLLRDINAMLRAEAAATRAEDVPENVTVPFRVELVDAVYEPMAGAGGFGDPSADPSGGGWGDPSADPSLAGGNSGGASSGAVDVTTRDRVTVTVILTSPVEDPQIVLEEGLEPWLRANAKREGVPYEIYVDPRSDPWTVRPIAVGAGLGPVDPVAPQRNAGPGSGRLGGRVPPPSAFPGGANPDPRGVPVSGPGFGPGSGPGFGPGQQISTGAAVNTGPAGVVGADDAALITAMQQEAPVGAALAAPRAESRHRIELRFTLLLNAAAPQGGES